MTTTDRTRLHRLVELIPESTVGTATGMLEGLLSSEPAVQALRQAPEDDAPLSDKGRRALDEAWEDVDRGEKPLSHDEVKRRIGSG